MRRAILLMVLLLFAPLLCLTPVTAQDSSATSVNISELGAFENTNETYTDPAGNEYPVLFVGETFHIDCILTVKIQSIWKVSHTKIDLIMV